MIKMKSNIPFFFHFFICFCLWHTAAIDINRPLPPLGATNNTRTNEQANLLERLDSQLTANNDEKIEISADDLELVLKMLQE